MNHVCIVTSAHPWDDVRVSSRMAGTFREAGYQVTWVGPDRSFFANEELKLDGVDYRLFPVGTGRVDRLMGSRRAERLAQEVESVDWWYSPDPDMAGRLPKIARDVGGRTMFDVHESYHGGLLERWFPGGRPPQLVREMMRRRISRTCSRVDLVIGVSDPVLEPYCAAQPNVVVIRNLAPAWFTPDRGAAEVEVEDRMRFLHGKLAVGNGTRQVALAVGQLSPEVQAGASVVMLQVAGAPEGATSEVRAIADSLAPDTLVVRPGVSHDEMADLMATFSVGLISYQRDLGYESLPNRLFEYMAAGLAILAPSYSPEIVKILEGEKIGLTADFEVPGKIAALIQWCVEHPAEVGEMGRRAREAYLAKYTWDTEARKLVTVMAQLGVTS